MPTFAEFFAGIGLVRMGLERQGWEIAFANDIDPRKYEMYKAQFPDADRHFLVANIKDIEATQIPTVDMATASFPCNDLSLAGGRAGIDGTRSRTIWSFISILRNLGTRKPRLVFIENVVGFLNSHQGNDFEAVLQSLNDLGYSIDSFIVDAAHFVPQSRGRLFIVGILNNPLRHSTTPYVSNVRPKELVEFILTHPQFQWDIRHLPPLPANKVPLSTILENLPETSPEWWNAERTDYLLSQMSNRHRAIANQMIQDDGWSYGTVFRRMRNGKSTAELRTDGIAGCLRTPRGGSAKQILFKAGFNKYYARLVTPIECARLMGAADYPITVSRDQAFLGFGDAVCVPVIEWIAQHYLNPAVAELAQLYVTPALKDYYDTPRGSVISF